MTQWRTTAALRRALALTGFGFAYAIVLQAPVVVVLVSPFLLLAALGLLQRPASEPQVRVDLRHRVLHEGTGTVSDLAIDDASDIEQVTRSAALTPSG